MPAPQLDQLDKQILRVLLEDARTPYLEIARLCGVSGATVHLRIQKLEKLGIIEGSRLKLNYKKLGYGITAFIGIYLDKIGMFEEVLSEVESITDIVECHYTTGNYAVFLKVLCPDTDGLRDLLLERIQKIPYVRRTETFISLQMNFERNPDLRTLFGEEDEEDSNEK